MDTYTLVLMAILIDIIVGDPRCITHPVVLIGALIHKGEVFLRKFTSSAWGLRLAGILLVICICAATYLVTWGLILVAGRIHPYLGLAVHLWLLSTTLAIKSLTQHARAVVEPLLQGDLVTARQRVALIVGRDTEQLNERDITRATVETVAENTVDGIISPLFYAFLGGAPLSMTYKAINTMDSMIGHRNERYLNLGWAAARLDDLANFLPARLAGIVYLLLSPATPGGFQSTLRAMRQDAPQHPSPNSGIPEAAVAGALGIQLGGTNYYQGQISQRAYMGTEKYSLGVRHIEQTIYLTYAVTVFVVLLLVWAGMYWGIT